MPRYRREINPGSVQHVISRFVDREFRFDVSGARREYLRRAGRVLGRCDWRALGFALMSSHVHWALRAGADPSAALIKPLHAGFAGWLNTVEGRLGPVFAERHRSLTFEGETTAGLVAYIHNNPVRAGVVGDPVDSNWTSHRAYLGLDPAPQWLDVELGLHLCGFSATASGRLAFHEMVRSRIPETKSASRSGSEMEVHRRRARAEAGGPVEVGAPTAWPSVEGLQLRVPIVLPANCHLRPRWDGDPWEVLRTVEQITGVSADELRARGRRRSTSHARRVAMLVWTRELQRPATEMARLLGLSSSSAAGLTSSATDETRGLAVELAQRIRGLQG